jgi:CubicO group peptidase (beta-lactamase class C family)
LYWISKPKRGVAMSKYTILLTALVVLVACNSQNKEREQETRYQTIDSLLAKSIVEWNVPGMAVGIIVNDTLFLSKGYGVVSMSGKESVSDTTLFGIASLTKSFTSLAVGISQKKGFLSIDDPIKKHLDQFETSNDSLTKSISFVDALSHRTGFSTFSGDLSWYGSVKSKAQVIDIVKNIPVSNGFRSSYGYNNVMFLAAGMAMENATNQNFEDFVSNQILSPLDMQFTTFNYSQTIHGENIATPHITIDSINKPIEFVNWTNMSPSGGLFSNIQDMLKWARFQWNPDTSIIDKKFLEYQHSVITPQKLSWFDQLNSKSVINKGYGLGWEVMTFQGNKVLMHNGGLDGMISQIVVVPDKKMAFIVLVNSSSPLPIVLGYEFLHRFIAGHNSPYYTEAYRKLVSGASVSSLSEHESKNMESLDIKALSGVYSDKLMGDVKIAFNSNTKTMEVVFSQAQLFDGVLSLDSSNNIQLEWKKISSLPLGKILTERNQEGLVTAFRIVCPNPDFRFEEVYFQKKY